jgi:phosphoglycolate phosphatase-like HAD superfamily hydrolase
VTSKSHTGSSMRVIASLSILLASIGTPAAAQTPATVSVVYFDLGSTLVKRAPDAPRPNIWIDGSQDALIRLKESGVRLGVLSNTGNFSWQQVREEILPEDFDATIFEEDLIVVSSAVGVQKPDAGIFIYSIEHAGVPPGDILFITESVDHVIAAQASGMRALWVTEGQLPQLVTELLERNVVGTD